MKSTGILLLLILCVSTSNAQIGKFLKRKAQDAKEALEGKKDEKIQQLQEEQNYSDTTHFNYAVALSDNASFFDSDRDKGNLFLSGLRNLKPEEVELSKAERAMNFNREGENLFRFRKFRLAEIDFFTALSLFIFGEDEDISDLEIAGWAAKFGRSAIAASFLRRGKLEDFETSSLSNFELYAFTRSMANLSLIKYNRGQFTWAEKLGKYNVSMLEGRFGAFHVATAAAKNNLATIYEDIGKYHEAELILEQVIKINKEAYGAESLPHAIALNNKALLWQKIGRYAEAKEILERCLTIAKPLVREKSKEYTNFLLNHALLLQDMQAFEEAEARYNEVLELKKRLFNANSPEYANLQRNLASLYLQMNREEEAKALLEEAAETYAKKFNKRHPSYAITLSYQAKLHRYLGEYETAEQLLEEVKAIQQEVLGERHPDYLNTLKELALVYWESGKLEDAVEQFEDVVTLQLELVDTYFLVMSEYEKTKFWDKIRPDLMIFNSFVTENYKEYPQLATQMFNLHLATKGLLLHSTQKVREQILTSGDEALIQEYEAWINEREHLSEVYTLSKEEIASENIDLDSLEKSVLVKEKALATKSQLFAKSYQNEQVSFAEVQNTLKNDENLVEIIRSRKFANHFTEEVNYIALIANNKTPHPKVVVIENGNELESDYYSIYKGSVTNFIEDGDSYSAFWEAIDDKLTAQTVYISLDGVYNQININTLVTPNGKFVLEEKSLIFLTSSRQLTESIQSPPFIRQEATLIGFPNYGNQGTIAELPGTKEEVEQLSLILGNQSTKVFLGEEANERNVKQIKNPHILHIATHGFFMEDVDDVDKGGKVFGIETEKAIENPLLRSGLLLTNAEAVIENVETKDTREQNNGILTAYEAMNLRLDDTDLVVLSACETGLGNVKAGEGVYGLQRAFQTAGVNAVVMSLWKVSDEATQLLMTNFYKNWKEGGDKLKAFRKAQLALKTEFPEPYYWGAFVLLN